MQRIIRNAMEIINGRSFVELFEKGLRFFHREGLRGMMRLLDDLKGISYSEWIARFDTISDHDRKLIGEHINRFDYTPTISILMPVYDAPADYLRKAIASVQGQLYPHWELCIADDASTLPHVRQILDEATQSDARIRVTFRQINGHISQASNTALNMANGDFVALLDHDDELTEHALYHVVAALNEHPGCDLIYSDEDKIDDKGQRFGHYFKPDWNPDLFNAQNLISHLGVYRRRIALEIGGFREGFEGSQDWDFALRFVQAVTANHVFHIPHVLYHWRASPSSTAVSIEVKQYAVAAAKCALEDSWKSTGRNAIAHPVGAGHFVMRMPPPNPLPKVSIVICTQDRLRPLKDRIERLIQHTAYADIEILVVANDSTDQEVLPYFRKLESAGSARVIWTPGPFNFSMLNNAAVTEAKGEVICLLNDKVFPKTPDWLKEMVAHAVRPEIGAVGAKLFHRDETVQHAGILLDGVEGGHLRQGYPEKAAGYGNRLRLPQNFSAVTAACLVVRKDIWEDVGGMDEQLPVAFNDVDFCLRIMKNGYRNLWLPQAELYHYESATRGHEDTPEKQQQFAREIAYLQQRWGDILTTDPAWNPNLALNGTRIGLAVPPRVEKPWLKHDER